MTTTLFDVQTGCGGTPHGETDAVTVDEFLATMARVDIGRALVRRAPDDGVCDLPAANHLLYEHCVSHAGLSPCPILAPNGGGDLAPEAKQVDDAIAHGACAVFLRPQADYWGLEPWACASLFQALEARRLPTYCQTDRVAIEQVAQLAERYPELPFIVAGVEYRTDRVLLPLMKAFPNVCLSIGQNYTVHQGIERFVAAIGSERLLFGSGFPDVDPMAAISMLMYADVSEEARQLIGAGNMERLAEGIQQ